MNEADVLQEYEIEKLSGAYLCGAILLGAYLYQANLHEANLSGADLRGAYLHRANLSGANLYRANLSGANLYQSDLSGANLYQSDLSRADLSKANLLGVQGLASMNEEMEMLVLLREATRQKRLNSPLLDTCHSTYGGAEFCQLELMKRGNPIGIVSPSMAGTYSIPSMAWLFSSSKEEFIEHLDKLISGEEPLLQR